MIVNLPQTTDESILRVVKLCYDYCFLLGRKEAGLLLGRHEELRLHSLQRLLDGDSIGPAQRRRHRRLPVLLPVLLKTPLGLKTGTLLNISARGMFVATDVVLSPAASIQIRLGKPGQVEYSFPCAIRWQSRQGGHGLGLLVHGIPLEVRHGAAA